MGTPQTNSTFSWKHWEISDNTLRHNCGLCFCEVVYIITTKIYIKIEAATIALQSILFLTTEIFTFCLFVCWLFPVVHSGVVMHCVILKGFSNIFPTSFPFYVSNKMLETYTTTKTTTLKLSQSWLQSAESPLCFTKPLFKQAMSMT